MWQCSPSHMRRNLVCTPAHRRVLGVVLESGGIATAVQRMLKTSNLRWFSSKPFLSSHVSAPCVADVAGSSRLLASRRTRTRMRAQQSSSADGLLALTQAVLCHAQRCCAMRTQPTSNATWQAAVEARHLLVEVPRVASASPHEEPSLHHSGRAAAHTRRPSASRPAR